MKPIVWYGVVLAWAAQLAAAHTNSSLRSIVLEGQPRLVSEQLLAKIQRYEARPAWMPHTQLRIVYQQDVATELVLRDSIESFPDPIFTDEQLRNGGFLLYLLFGVYAFTLLAVICNDYFIPCVELICEDLKIPQNVAAATFMAVATSCPEFFVNVISTFLTQSDMGVGTIVGSAIFNALGVAAIGGLAAIRPILIGMGPVTRDVIIYMINVSVLVVIVWDGKVEWFEATVLAALYVLYFVFMFNSVRIFRLCEVLLGRCCNKTSDGNIVSVPSNGAVEGVDNKGFNDPIIVSSMTPQKVPEPETVSAGSSEESQPPHRTLFVYPRQRGALYQAGWLYLWPCRLVLALTVPWPRRYRAWYPLAFLMCIVWIGGNSYFVSWSMTVIGHTFRIPDSVMGMTFLAFGGCLPEAFSVYIMSRRGEGGIGVSNALGANSLAILFALGFPWLIKTLVDLAQGAEDSAVYINSSGIDFVVGSLLLAVACLWLALCAARFTLRRSVGCVLAALYLVFIVFAVLVETGVLLDRDDVPV